ncbi:hypothetical protein [Robertmurraya korlensis]|uniref:hypothetical protein n=1 Tax=Robertmurraya korlensis TaxID=519977 RepID=UPI0008264DAE|nr:hypothetical protein [Robertmurraya korlensis]
MDRTSYIAGILYYLTNDVQVQEVAIDILNGELTVKEAGARLTMQPYVMLAKKRLKELEKNTTDNQHVDIIQFVENNLYSYQS